MVDHLQCVGCYEAIANCEINPELGNMESLLFRPTKLVKLLYTMPIINVDYRTYVYRKRVTILNESPSGTLHLLCIQPIQFHLMPVTMLQIENIVE